VSSVSSVAKFVWSSEFRHRFYPCYHPYYLSRDEHNDIKGDAMPRFRNVAFLVTILFGTLLLTACPSQTNISKINADPGRYRGKEVGIVGRVTDSYGVLGNGAYEIDDGTGRIWVATRRGIPSRGSQVGTKGYVHNGFSFGGRSYGTVIEETDRRSKGR
jgi:hypothetical protein